MIKLVVFDFDGVFTDNRVLVLDNGQEAVFCNRSDFYGLERLRQKNIDFFVLSTETNPVVSHRCKKIKVQCIQGCSNKKLELQKQIENRLLKLEEVAYLGNDINDLECLQIVGLPACVADAFEPVKEVSKYITKRKGGDCAVREFCEYIAGL